MEACGSTHHWPRQLSALGYSVELIAPQFVNPTASEAPRVRLERGHAWILTRQPRARQVQQLVAKRGERHEDSNAAPKYPRRVRRSSRTAVDPAEPRALQPTPLPRRLGYYRDVVGPQMDLTWTAEALVSQRAEHAHVQRIGHRWTDMMCVCVRNTPATCSPGEDKPPTERHDEFGLDGHWLHLIESSRRQTRMPSVRQVATGCGRRHCRARCLCADHPGPNMQLCARCDYQGRCFWVRPRANLTF